MKKIFTTFGLLMTVMLLAGCGQSDIKPATPAAIIPPTSSAPVQKSPVDVVTQPAASVLPEGVSAQPGTTADEEIKNIDKDLQSMDDASLGQGLSDTDLGL